MKRSLPLVFTLTLGLILSGSSVASGSTSVAPSPLTPDHVSLQVTISDMQAQTGTVRFSWSSAVTANAAPNASTTNTLSTGQYHWQQNEASPIRVFFGLSQSLPGTIYQSTDWLDASSARWQNYPTPRTWNQIGSTDSFDLNLSQLPLDGPYAMVCVKMRYGHISGSNNYIVCSQTFQLFAGTVPPFSVTANPSLQLNEDLVVSSTGSFSFGSAEARLYACDVEIPASNGHLATMPQPQGGTFSGNCKQLWDASSGGGFPTNLASAFINLGGTPRPSFSIAIGNYVHILQVTSTPQFGGGIMTPRQHMWPASVAYVSGSGGGSSATLTAPWSPVASITAGLLDVTPRPSWSSGTPTREIYACMNPVAAQLTTTNYANIATVFQQSICIQLSSTDSVNSPVYTSDLNTAFAPGLGSRFSAISTQRPHILYVENNNSVAVWAASVNFAPDSASAAAASSEASEPEPVQFGGPLISGFSRPVIAAGTEGAFALTGKRLHSIRSAMIGGVAAEVRAGRNSAQISIPSELAPGVYNLVLETTNGRITVLRFVTVGGPRA